MGLITLTLAYTQMETKHKYLGAWRCPKLGSPAVRPRDIVPRYGHVRKRPNSALSRDPCASGLGQCPCWGCMHWRLALGATLGSDGAPHMPQGGDMPATGDTSARSGMPVRAARWDGRTGAVLGGLDRVDGPPGPGFEDGEPVAFCQLPDGRHAPSFQPGDFKRALCDRSKRTCYV